MSTRRAWRRARALGALAGALALAAPAAARGGAEEVAALREHAALLALAGRLAGAETTLRHAHGLAPLDVATLRDLATVLVARGEPRGAQRLLDRALALAPERGELHYARGIALAASGRRSAAERAYRRAFALAPELADPRLNPDIVRNRGAERALIASWSGEARPDQATGSADESATPAAGATPARRGAPGAPPQVLDARALGGGPPMNQALPAGAPRGRASSTARAPGRRPPPVAPRRPAPPRDDS
jgi:tetratricopeptide (TPR) repeat protein